MAQKDADKTLTVHRGDLFALAKSRPCVIVVEGANLGKQVRLNEEQIVIGRSEAVELFLDDKLLSREHARLVGERNGDTTSYFVEDLTSTNGTYLNGTRVARAPLNEGDKIHVGSTILRFSYHDEIDSKYQRRIYDLINYDDLTGLFTLRFFYAELDKELHRGRRSGAPLALLMMDLDHFKKINDSFGHQTGSYVLKEVGRILRESLRLEDVAGRYGGEEFIAYLPATSKEHALVCADRIRERIARFAYHYGGHQPHVRISIGLAAHPEDGDTVEALVRKADGALYRAKEEGRNRVCTC